MKKNTTYSSHPSLASRIAHKRAKTKYPTYDTSLIRPKKSKKPAIIASVATVIFIAIIACLIVFSFSGCSKTLEAGKTVEVTIEEGSSTNAIAEKMASSGVVDNSWVFKSTVTEMGAESSLKPGTYLFEGGKTVREYVQILCDGPESTSPKVTVAEGTTLSKIASEVEKSTKGRISEKEFLDAASDSSVYKSEYSFLSTAGNNSLEGFLFPKTYSISSKDSAKDIIKKMLDQFNKDFQKLDLTFPTSKNFNVYDVVTLASIVEREAPSSLFKKVAGVFYNRLDSGMHLDSDATTAYYVGHQPTSEEVHANNEYSTYTNYGLCPTPICSPSLESLQAVCNPENTDYLFFAFNYDADGNLQYKFSTTFLDHQQALIDLGIVY